MKTIYTQEGAEVQVDDEDYPILSRHKWYLHNGHNTKTKYAHTNIHGTLLMHRLIVGSNTVVVDHIDHNGLNNQKANLRVISDSQNKHSGPLRKDNKTGYKGVFYVASRGKYVAYIRKNNKRKHIGVFDDKYSAAEAYNKVALELYGEQAYQNDLHIQSAS